MDLQILKLRRAQMNMQEMAIKAFIPLLERVLSTPENQRAFVEMVQRANKGAGLFAQYMERQNAIENKLDRLLEMWDRPNYRAPVPNGQFRPVTPNEEQSNHGRRNPDAV
jgi:hypothetical protein